MRILSPSVAAWGSVGRAVVVVVAFLAVTAAVTTVVMAEATTGDDFVKNGAIHQKHPLEDLESWRLHVARLEGREPSTQAGGRRRHRRLVAEGDESAVDAAAGGESGTAGDDTPYTVMHKKPKTHIPYAGGDTTHGIMIDAGSQGTRLHIYEWDKRILLDEDDLLDVAHGRKLSIPTSNSRWTDKYTPGLDVFAFHRDPKKIKAALRGYLGPLIDFAKTVLAEKEDQWGTYPIFLKATGGMRTLPKRDRVRLMEAIRDLLDSSSFSPFSFDDDEQARVISGEEEAIYGWVGVNFAMGTLIDSSVGNGVAKNPKLTYGMLEMGGASTQIAYFENNGDLMADLFKLQLGGARHWNIYTHSYLYFGINGAWDRLNARLYSQGTVVNPCLPVGSDIGFESWITVDKDGYFLPRSDPSSIMYNITMRNNRETFDYDACFAATYDLLRKDTNRGWCTFEMDGECAMGGVYQPPLPKNNAAVDEFIATSNFVDVYRFLDLGESAAVSTIGERAREVCEMSWSELQDYNVELGVATKSDEGDDTLAQMCFRSVFVYQLLSVGWGFGENYNMEVKDVINGQKLGWALGCMLYEINTLPWNFHPELLYRGPPWWLISFYILFGTVAGSVVGFILAMRLSRRFNRAVRQSVWFNKIPGSHIPGIRKSLRLPPSDDLSSVFSHIEEEDKRADEDDRREVTAFNRQKKHVSYT